MLIHVFRLSENHVNIVITIAYVIQTMLDYVHLSPIEL